jgi:hypothetical protein
MRRNTRTVVSTQRPPLIFHIGTHRTGTTSIQWALAQNRETVRSRGIYYPNPRPYFGGTVQAHFSFAHLLTGEGLLGQAKIRRFIDQVISDVRPGEKVVLSAEPAYRHILGTTQTYRDRSKPGWDYWAGRRGYLESLAAALKDFDVTVLIFLRRQDEFISSGYHEAIVRARSDRSDISWQSFDAYRETEAVLCDYSRQIGLIEEVFGNVDVRRHDPKAAMPSFFEAIGLQGMTLPERRDNLSSDPRLTLWLRGQDPTRRSQQIEFLRSTEARGLFSGKSHFWKDDEQRAEFLSRFGGPYGADFFEPPAEPVVPAGLDEADTQRIDEAYLQWQRARASRR